jgi:MFS family permease
MLAPDKGLATLPISVFVLGMWMGTLPMGVLARRLGRRSALQIGTVCGVLTGLICCVAVLQGSFLLFNVGAVFSGFYASAHQSYRFAARHRERGVPAKGDFVGSNRWRVRWRGRSTTRHRDAKFLAALSVRRNLYRTVRARSDRGRRADVREHTQATATLGRR